MLPKSLAIFGTPAHRVLTTDTAPTTMDPGNCPNNPSQALSWIENLRTFLDNDLARYSEANKTLIALNRMTPEPLIRFTEKWYDRIVDQPLSSKIFDTLVRDFKLAITRRLSRNPPSTNFSCMTSRDRACFLRHHPALVNQLSTTSQSTPFKLPTFPAFRKWNPMERAKYLRRNHPSLKTSQTSPRYPPGLPLIPSRPPLSSSLTHSLASVITAIPTERTLKVAVTLHVYRRDHETIAVIDSGASGCFIDPQLVHQLNLKTFPLIKPVQAYNVDGTTNCKGNITQEVDIELSFPDSSNPLHSETTRLMILNLGKPQLILSMPWLQKWNPEIDWVRRTICLPDSEVSFPRDVEPLCECLPEIDENREPQDHLLQCLGLDADHKIESLIQKRRLWLDGETIAKTTLSTEIAQQEKPVEAVIPTWCTDFKDVFSEKTHETLPPHRPYDHVINLKPDFTPKIAKIYSLNPAKKITCKEFVQEHLKTGRIVPSKSPQASPFFFVPKKDGTLRPCQDYHYLNSFTIRDAYPLPLIPDLINDMKESTLFTKFDIRWGYNNIHIREEDQWKAAFITPEGLFEPTVMFFGFCNAPPTFQAFMNHIFADYIQEKWLKVYMDDMGIHTKDDVILHHERTRKVLLRLREHGLTIKLSKTTFDAPHIEFLGTIIGQGEIKMDPRKLEAIRNWKPPTTVKGIRSFTGFANFYRKFIPGFSNIVAPLNLLTRKSEPWNWTPLQQRAFDHLKEIFTSAPILLIPDVSKPFSIMTDAFLVTAGAILLQNDTNGDRLPCAYFSKTFAPAQRNYDIYDQELLAVILALEEWRQYLQGTQHPVTILTDHKNLSYVKDPRKLSRRQARWALFLQDFDLIWEVTPGTKMAPADALSRKDLVDTSTDNIDVPICPNLTISSPKDAEPLRERPPLAEVLVQTLDLQIMERVRNSSPSDPLVIRALQDLKKGNPLFPRSSLSDWTFTDNTLYYKGRMYVPPDTRQSLVSALHESPTLGHAGCFRTKTFVEQDFWWPGLSTFVNNFVTGCAVCQQNKVNTHPTVPPLHPIPSKTLLPFKQLSVDLITDLPKSAGFDSLMVVVDHGLSKGVILVPCTKNIDAAGVAALFFNHIFKQFGLHNTLISDRGPQFASAFAQELARLLHYDVRLSTAYHPQTDGQTERTNQEIETYLRIFCTNNPKSWTNLLTTAEFQHNTAPHHSTKTSPFSLLLGYEPRAYPSLGKTFLPALEKRLSSLEETRQETLAAHELSRRLMSNRITQKFTPWRTGDKVWLEATHLRINYPSRKLAPKRLGPFEILQVLSPLTYRLKLPPTWKIHDVFHASLLSSYKETSTHGPNFPSPPPDLINSEEEYEVEKILAHQGTSGRRRYLTAWKGYPSSENTWEPESNLTHAQELLNEYKTARSL